MSEIKFVLQKTFFLGRFYNRGDQVVIPDGTVLGKKAKQIFSDVPVSAIPDTKGLQVQSVADIGSTAGATNFQEAFRGKKDKTPL